jgi:hypothetical protein
MKKNNLEILLDFFKTSTDETLIENSIMTLGNIACEDYDYVLIFLDHNITERLAKLLSDFRSTDRVKEAVIWFLSNIIKGKVLRGCEKVNHFINNK